MRRSCQIIFVIRKHIFCDLSTSKGDKLAPSCDTSKQEQLCQPPFYIMSTWLHIFVFWYSASLFTSCAHMNTRFCKKNIQLPFLQWEINEIVWMPGIGMGCSVIKQIQSKELSTNIFIFPSNNKRPPFDPVYECLVCQICCQILLLPNTLPSRPTYLLFSALCPSLRLFSDSVDWDFVESYIFPGAPLTLRNLDDIISILCIDAVGRYWRRNQFLGQSEGTKLCREEALFLNIHLK